MFLDYWPRENALNSLLDERLWRQKLFELFGADFFNQFGQANEITFVEVTFWLEERKQLLNEDYARVVLFVLSSHEKLVIILDVYSDFLLVLV